MTDMVSEGMSIPVIYCCVVFEGIGLVAFSTMPEPNNGLLVMTMFMLVGIIVLVGGFRS